MERLDGGVLDRRSTEIRQAWFTSRLTPLGELFIAATDRGVVASHFADEISFMDEMGRLGYELDHAQGAREPGAAIALEATSWIDRYFGGFLDGLDLPVDFLRQTAFGLAVLEEVAFRVPFGSTATYGEIAERVGRPRAGRAVGNIMASCPFSVIVPCHRIVHAGGPTGEDVRFGTADRDLRKRWLLEFEALAHVPTSSGCPAPFHLGPV